ncbi:ZZ-type zinc finger-containing protein 3-like [Tubulanus polymorphus]|uniref:ZZ-type zinc finger-containing protein 3-like n=1 Tax=Tubulanus polymorphus TaxID=672921 RepID=UPI003DA35ACE
MDSRREDASSTSSSDDRFIIDGIDYMQQGRVSPKNGENIEKTDCTNGVYYFETDHCALQGNKDYQKLLKTLAILESQRIKALTDLEKLMDSEEAALKEPLVFVQRLQNKEDLGLPKPLFIPEIPKIAWDEYTYCAAEFNMSLSGVKTRGKRVNLDNLKPTASNSISNDSSIAEKVRGRVKVGDKSDTFNKLWTVDEQKQLEDLLVQYPPEAVEVNRYKKIANALGNRTTQQVASRIQKYFVKLHNAGLPIPGRLPSKLTILHNTAKTTHKHQKHNRFYWKPSTFMQSYDPPVYMSDDDCVGDEDDDNDDDRFDESFSHIKPAVVLDSRQENASVSDDESIPVELRASDEYTEIMRLKKLKRKKIRTETSSNSQQLQHIGYKCDRCDSEPIIGIRWTCTDCPSGSTVDLCEECIHSSFETVSHHATHRFKAVHRPTPALAIDMDYTKLTPSGYDYLDPNYMPACETEH